MSNAMPTTALSSDPTRRNVLFNTTATVGAAVSAVRFRTIAAIFSTIQLASPDLQTYVVSFRYDCMFP